MGGCPEPGRHADFGAAAAGPSARRNRAAPLRRAGSAVRDFVLVGLAHVRCTSGSATSRLLHYPRVLVVVGDLELDVSERFVPCSYCPTKPSACSQPASAASARRRAARQCLEWSAPSSLSRPRSARRDECGLGDLRPMWVEMKSHAGDELSTRSQRLGAALVDGLDHVVRRGLDEAAVSQRHPHTRAFARWPSPRRCASRRTSRRPRGRPALPPLARRWGPCPRASRPARGTAGRPSTAAAPRSRR